MQDMHVIQETFRVLSQCVRDRSFYDDQCDTHGILSFNIDPHPDADEWIDADDDARVALRDRADKRLAALVKSRANQFPSKTERNASHAAYMRAWRKAHPAANIESARSWREANREKCRQHMRAYRAVVNADPVRREAVRVADAMRKRARKLARKGLK